MKQTPCEKCMKMLTPGNCRLRCGYSFFEMCRLLYAYRCPNIPGAHATTVKAQEHNREAFQVLSENCVFWGKTALPEALPGIVKEHFKYKRKRH